jgi:hypothetical protein
VKQSASRRERKADNSGPSKRVVIPVVRISDAHRDDGKRFVVHAEEKLTAFLELESVIRVGGELS